MIRRKIMVIGFLAFCLTATLLIDVTSSAPYDPWYDVNDDGIIDIVDLVSLGIRFGEEGTPINKTALLLDLLDRVEALETGGFVGAPAYDSGWVAISQSQYLILTHNLGTTEVLVYVIGNTSYGQRGINQIHYGTVWHDTETYGLLWRTLDNATITIYRSSTDPYWQQVRVIIWKILPTP